MKRSSIRWGVAAFAAGSLALTGLGSAEEYMPIANPQGPVALAERDILIRAVEIMLIVIIPVFVMAAWFSWKYRASNTDARYEPNWISNKIDAITWIVPGIIWVSLAYHVWTSTHELDPYKPLESSAEPLEVQVVAQDWKWLFIYPEQGIASVNQIAFPVDVPLTLRITSDTVMNSFFIPALGSQIYAMAGMQTQLNLMASETGTFRGRNTQYSGDGFPDQHFEASAMTEADFDAWVEKVKQSSNQLDTDTYEELAKPSSLHPVTYYSRVEPDLYLNIIKKYDSGMVMSNAMPTE